MKALALVESPEHVCCRYRVRAFEPALARAGCTLTVGGLSPRTAARWLQIARLPRVDTVLLQRRLLPLTQLLALRQRARRFVFDFDDAVLYRDSYDPRGPVDTRRARRFRAVVSAADLVVAGNDFLADCALREGARPERVQVIPTCVATDHYQPAVPPADRSGLDLVWIGSSSTLQGLEQTRALWDRVAREVPGVRMRVICDRFPDLGAMTVVAVPWSESTEALELARGDVGVATMPDGLWSRGKCGLKVLQYGAAGLPVLANPVGVHSEMVRPGVNGFLPRGEEDWVDSVRRLASDVETRRRMGRAARESVESNYSVSAWESAFVSALTGVPESGVGGPVARRSRRTGHPGHGSAIAGASAATPRWPGVGACPPAGLGRNGGNPV